MKAATQKRIINRLLAAPASHWEDHVTRILKRHPDYDLQPLISTLASVAEQTAWLAEYIQHRGQYKAPHSKAAKAAARYQVKVSRALGFSYPDRRAYRV